MNTLRKVKDTNLFISKDGKTIVSINGNLTYTHKIEISKNGYCRIYHKRKHLLLHRLVYNAWHGEIGKGMVIDHIDNDTTNNHIDNLQAITQSENIKRAYCSGRKVATNIKNLIVYDTNLNVSKEYKTVKEFLVDIKAPSYIIKHGSLGGLNKVKSLKNRYKIISVSSQTTIERVDSNLVESSN